MSRSSACSGALAAALAACAADAPARADTPPPAAPVSGVERPAEQAGDVGREVGNAILWLPRHILKFLYLGTTTAAAVVDNSPVVPTVQDVLATADGRIYVLPTLAETGNAVSVGARLIMDLDVVASSLRVGFGGVDSIELEPRVALRFSAPFPSILGFELLYKRDDQLEYAGLGQVPEEDPRNHFRPGHAGRIPEYFEERTRGIITYAIRPHEYVEVAASGSVNRRAVSDGDAEPSLSDVFDAGTIPGADVERYTSFYGELAARFDTRPTRGKPSPGLLAEGYLGPGTTFEEPGTEYLRYGGRVAGFVPVYRTTNIFSPQLIVDGLAPLGDGELPFSELVHQPDFRGLDTRRDHVSLVGTLEYRWLFVSQLAMRVFFDGALVAPSWDELHFEDTRWATGLMLDMHSDRTQLGRLGFSAGPDGVRALVSVGISSGYGDRQHQD